MFDNEIESNKNHSEANEIGTTAEAQRGNTSRPSRAHLLASISETGSFQEALQIDVYPTRPTHEVVKALGSYIRELGAAKEARWQSNSMVGSVAGYTVTRKRKFADPDDGTIKEGVRTTILVNPSKNGVCSNVWLDSVFWPQLSFDIDGEYYFQSSVLVSFKVIKDEVAVANEVRYALANTAELLALGSFDRCGFNGLWRKP